MNHFTEEPSTPIDNVKTLIDNIQVETIADLATILFPVIFAIAVKSLKDSKDKVDSVIDKLTILRKDIREILPETYLKRIDQILAQIAILGRYDRVVLGVFHNGVVGTRYSKFEKIAILSCYVVSGVEELPEMGKDLNIEDIDIDIEYLRENNNFHTTDIDRLLRESDSNVYMYLKNRNIQILQNELLTRKGLDLGVLSCHHCNKKDYEIPDSDRVCIEELKREIMSIIDVYAQTNKKFKPIAKRLR